VHKPDEENRLLSFGESDVVSITPSPDGTRVAFQAQKDSRPGPLSILDIETEITSVVPFEGAVSRPVWSPDGSKLGFTFFESPRSYLFVKDLNSLEEPIRLDTPNLEQAQIVGWLPGGDGVLIVGAERLESDRKLYSYDFTSAALTLLIERDGPIFDVALSPEGQFVIYAVYDAGSTSYYIQPLSGGGFSIFPGEDVADLEWSPSGNWIYFRRGSEERQIFRVPVSADPVFRITGVPEVVYNSDTAITGYYPVSADGQFLIGTSPEASTRTSKFVVVANWVDHLNELAPPSR
jgi:Tol biopolymer transport system component